MTRSRFSRRCIPTSFVVAIAVCALFVGAVATAAGSGSSPVLYASNGVSASVRSIQPAVSGLFQLHAPRVWADAAGEAGEPVANGVPDFLDSWEAFSARTSSAILKNGYVFTTVDGLGHEVLYAGVQRASSSGPSSVVVELNQKAGGRVPGDLRISADIDAAGSLGATRFERFAGEAKGGKFLPIAILPAEGCNDAGTACVVANGALLEVGYNLTALGKPEKEFSGIQLRTPDNQEAGTIRIMAAFTAVDGLCVKEVGGINNATCTANDVRLASVRDVVILQGDTCNPNIANDTITIQSFTGIFTSGPQRYDIGSYVATDGGGTDGARTGSCTRVGFQNNTAGLTILDTDSCADIAANQTVAIPMGPITIKCVDAFELGADGNPTAGTDGNIDFFHCETWAQQANEIICNNSTDIKAGTPSKCGCSLTGAAAGFCIAVDDGNSCTTEVCQGNCDNAAGTGSKTTCSANAGCTVTGETCRGIEVRSINVTNGTACGDDPGSSVCDLAPTCQTGVCTPRFAPNTTECRAADGECDVAESCTGTTAACPSDAVKGGGVTCSTDGNVCTNDICNGTSKTCTHSAVADGPRTGCDAAGDQCNNASLCVSGSCQPGGPKADGTNCEIGTSGDLCDAQDKCETGVCVEKYAAASNVCRAAGGTCDVAESCTGSSAECPTDAKITGQCRASAGDCDVPESCNGTSNDCPADGFKTNAVQCRGAAGVCDVAESCSGSAATCPTDLKSTAECRASAGFCDLPESCNGTTNDCPNDAFKTNAVECRASAGPCDLLESCTGNSAACPDNAFKGPEVVCRARVNSCDADEHCTGSSASCGADVCLGGQEPISYP